MIERSHRAFGGRIPAALAVASLGGAAQAEASSTSLGVASSAGLTTTATTSHSHHRLSRISTAGPDHFTRRFEVLSRISNSTVS
jgi:hypothetical protein